MTAITPSRPSALPVPRWSALVLAVALAAALLWTVGFEGGVLSETVARSGTFLHELFHDGRHLLGVPCH